MGYPPFGGADSYRPDRDRDREMPPSPNSHIPYYERDRLDDRDRDFYSSRGPRSSGGPSGGPSGSSSSNNPISDYDRYRSGGGGGRGSGRPTWESRRVDRDHRPERIITDREPNLVRSGRNSPISASYPSSAPPTAISRDRNNDFSLPKSAALDERKEDERQQQQQNEDDTSMHDF